MRHSSKARAFSAIRSSAETLSAWLFPQEKPQERALDRTRLYRKCSALRPIVHGLLAAGLFTLVAAAQQPAAPPPASAAAAVHTPNAKTTDASPVSDAASDQTQTKHDAPSDGNNTGVSNPDAVTPDTSSNAASEGQTSTQPAADATPAPTYVDNSNPMPAAETGDGSILEEGATGRRFFPDQPSQPMTPELDSDKPSRPDPAATTPSAFTPSGVTVVPPPQQSTTAPASSEITPTRLDSATQSAPSQAAPDSSIAPSSAPAPEVSAPQQTAPSTPPAPAESTAAPQQSTPSVPAATPPVQTP